MWCASIFGVIFINKKHMHINPHHFSKIGFILNLKPKPLQLNDQYHILNEKYYKCLEPILFPMWNFKLESTEALVPIPEDNLKLGIHHNWKLL